MPFLTRLAQKGILFERAYAVYPESIKGLFSVLCATYPALDTAPAVYEQIRLPSLPETLQRAGYHTALFHSGRFAYLGMESIIRQRGFQTLEDAGAIGGDQNSSFGIDDERCAVRHILAWLDRLPRTERFFITYLPIAGHHPYTSPGPGPFAGSNDFERYCNALHHADRALAELREGVCARGQDRNTLLVVYGDHGEAFGQHEGNYAHTLAIFDENVRVPLLFVAPDLTSAPVRAGQAASLVDLAPTVLDLLGLPIPQAYQGQSLLDGNARIALMFTDYSLCLLGLHDDGWKFIYELDSRRARLFNVHDDPAERHDMSPRQT